VRKYQLQELGKLIEYILFYRPDEFGLFLDDDGSLPIKELLWAFHEEEGWKHIRLGHLKELAYSQFESAFTLEENCIKPKQARELIFSATVPPRLLFHAARRKAYPVILKHGLKAAGRPYVPLATTEEVALRIGRRRDPKPILLTIHAAQAHDKGHVFHLCGEFLYLVRSLPPSFLSGPPVHESTKPAKASRPKAAEPRKVEVPAMVGSFLLDPARDPDPMRRERKKRDKERKRQRSRERRLKRSGR
jgi:putative RNA 2'-phosphotransferase